MWNRIGIGGNVPSFNSSQRRDGRPRVWMENVKLTGRLQTVHLKVARRLREVRNWLRLSWFDRELVHTPCYYHM